MSEANKDLEGNERVELKGSGPWPLAERDARANLLCELHRDPQDRRVPQQERATSRDTEMSGLVSPRARVGRRSPLRCSPARLPKKLS
jgi:hypothetical protein